MFNLRKLYLRIRLFLYSYRHIISSVFLFCALSFVLCYFIDAFVFGEIIVNQAYNDFTSKKCDNAINLYDVAYKYYTVANFSADDKEMFMEIPYNKAICYIHEHKKEKAIQSMLNGLVAIQSKYGVFSRENATFIRKYLIAFYLDNGQTKLAETEFNNLMTIYKNIGYDNYEMADMIRISGDLFYAQKNYDVAIQFYTKAYNIISKQHQIDYDIFKNIVERIATYEAANKRNTVAMNIYESSIQTILANGKEGYESAALLLINQAKLYEQLGETKPAVAAYEKAIDLIVKLPSTNYLKRDIKEYWLALRALYTNNGDFSKADDIDVKISRHERFPFLY